MEKQHCCPNVLGKTFRNYLIANTKSAIMGGADLNPENQLPMIFVPVSIQGGVLSTKRCICVLTVRLKRLRGGWGMDGVL